MFDYKEYVDQREILEFLIRNYVFVFFFGITAIIYWIPEYKKRQISILTILCILIIVYTCVRYRDNNDIEIRKL
jgi:hypothetical protein